MVDFTLSSYAAILEAAIDAGYNVMAVADSFDRLENAEGPVAILRHDVDRQPQNALAMAELEAQRNIQSTYYFRILPVSFRPDIIGRIAELGHEIGYHYEDLDLARGDKKAAIDLFAKNLAKLREVAPIRSIAMHGSPLASESNMAIWDDYDFKSHDVIDAILSFDYADFVFFTDSGRTFGQTGANLRDYVGNAQIADDVQTSQQLADYLKNRRADKVKISVHPERWNEGAFQWTRQYATDLAANSVKRALKLAGLR